MIIHNGIPAGNIYNKYNTKNPIARHLVNNFLHSAKELILKYRQGIHSITEVGCGEGYLASAINSLKIAPIKACDFSPEIIALAKQLYGKENIAFYTKDIFAINSTEEADLIVCCEVLEHLSNPKAALERLSAVSKKYCLISVPNEPLWSILNMCRGKYLKNLGNTPGHVNHWSSKDFCRFISLYIDIIEVRRPLPWTVVWGKPRGK